MIVRITSKDNIESIRESILELATTAKAVKSRCYCLFMDCELQYAIDELEKMLSQLEPATCNCHDDIAIVGFGNGSKLYVESYGMLQFQMDSSHDPTIPRYATAHFVGNCVSHAYIPKAAYRMTDFAEFTAIYNADVHMMKHEADTVIAQDQARFAAIQPELAASSIHQMAYTIRILEYDPVFRRRDSERFHTNRHTDEICDRCQALAKSKPPCCIVGDMRVAGESCPFRTELTIASLNYDD